MDERHRLVLLHLKVQTESDRLADCLYKAAEQILKNQVIRTDYARDGDPDWEEDFYILRHTLCPAVLTENFFQDSLSDIQFLQNEAGRKAIVDTHVEGIVEWLSHDRYSIKKKYVREKPFYLILPSHIPL